MHAISYTQVIYETPTCCLMTRHLPYCELYEEVRHNAIWCKKEKLFCAIEQWIFYSYLS